MRASRASSPAERGVGRGAPGVGYLSEARDAAAVRVGAEHGVDRGVAGEAFDQGLVECALELAGR